MTVLRTPYRIDIKQPIYFIIDDLSFLQTLLDENVMDAVNKAITLGDFKPQFPQKQEN